MAGDIVVVGSVNLDIVVGVERHPRPGETVLGSDHFRSPGGKGANQAVAAARLGASVGLVGCVGDDDVGHALVQGLAQSGVDTDMVVVDPQAPSGLALITVDGGGENTIVVSPGANSRLAERHIDAVAARLSAAAAVLLQLEIAVPTVQAAADAAAGLVILNPAPAAVLPPRLLGRVDVLVPNRAELATLADSPIAGTLDDAEQQARSLAGPERIVVTLGADGALVLDAGAVAHVPALPVDAVDTTAAGDAFCGALAVALSGGASLAEAARHGNTAAAVAVTRKGAQRSMPVPEDIATLPPS